MKRKKLLIILLKVPQNSRIKTKLARITGNTAARKLYSCMLADLQANLAGLEVPVHYYLDHRVRDHTFLGTGGPSAREFKLQCPGRLGRRMAAAFREGFEANFSSIILMGTDTPQVDRSLLERYLARLDEHEAVLGPTREGGYYLIGFNKENYSRIVFSRIPWSTPQVLRRTLARFMDLHLNCYLGPMQRTINTFEDLKALIPEQEASGRIARVSACFKRMYPQK